MSLDPPAELPWPEEPEGDAQPSSAQPSSDEALSEPLLDVKQPNLLDVDPSWADHWKGMPSYDHVDMQPDTTLLVHFRDQRSRQEFAKLVNQQLTATTKFIWFPKAEIGTAADKVFTGKKVVPHHPVYIISKGRWESRLTSRALEWIGVPYHIVIEPQEYDQYAKVIDPAKILVLPFSNLGLGGIPARNWVWEHAISVGAERHWILDDNISGFCRFQDNLKVEVDSGVTFCAVEDWVDRYKNVAMAAFNYDYFAPRKQGAKIKPITLNTRCYSGILIRNDLKDAEGNPIRWRGRYNEDTDLSLRILKEGYVAGEGGRWATALFNAFLMYKKPTLTMKGGNTDELYKGAEAMAEEWEKHAATCKLCKECTDGYPTEQHPQASPCDEGRVILSKDGRWLMAESLREQHPDCTTVERKWRRWQHQVDYRRFRDNRLILKPDAKIDTNYEMELGAMPAVGAAGSFYQSRAGNGNGSKPKTSVKPQPVVQARPDGPSALDFIISTAEPARPEQPALGPEGTRAEEAPSSEERQPISQPGQPLGPSEPEPAPKPDDPGWRISGWQNLRVEATTFAVYLRARGHRFFVREGRFFVSESSRLTAEDREAIKRFKPELIALAEQVPPSFSSTSFFDSTVEERTQSLAQFLGSEPPRTDPSYVPDEPPILTGVDEIILNFATDGLDWAGGSRPVGVAVSTLDGQLTRFLPFGFRGGGNLSEDTVKRWFKEQIRGKRITNANTRFEVHMAREWGCDLEEQSCTASDVMHYAALLDDHRKRFALDVLINDFLPDEPKVERLDERDHAGYAASEVASRERYTVEATAKLRNVMWPLLDKEELQEVRQLEDEVIFPVCEMERNGVLLDVPLMEHWHEEATKRYGELMLEIADEAGFAYDGTAKAKQRLFEHCGLPPSESFAEDVMGAIDHPLVKKAFFASQCASLDSKTFAAYLKKVDANGIMRFEINQLRGDDGGTVSGRFSIGLVQQVPNHDNHHAVFGDEWFPRRLFISKTGSVLEADAAQIEFRLFASDAGTEQILEAYRDDPWTSYHKTTWNMMKAYKPDMLYVHQKSFNFARQYGAKMVKLAVMMGFITKADGEEIKREKRWNDPRLAQIKEIEAAYQKINPAGDKLLDLAAHLAKPACDQWCKRGDALHRQHPHRGYIKTLSGRRSRFRAYDKHYIALNRRLQGGGADIMKKKLVELHRERKHTGLLMRMTVHDAAVGDAVEGTKEKVAEILNRQSYPTRVPILWEVGVGSNWAEAKG